MSSKPFRFTYLCFTILLTSLFHLFQAKSIPSNETDLLSLIAFRDQVEGLSSWNQSFHFCQWEGITCGKRHLRVAELDLSNQSFIGSISPHIGNLTFLRFIDLADNKFYGELPQEIGRLRRLKYINLGGNSFEGTIPVNLSQCTDLRVLSLAQNRLSGNVPPQLGSLSKLSYFSLYANNLTGSIPLSFGNLSSLQKFSLGQNFLEGSIPNSFGRLSKLTFFNVEINRLSGHIPSSIFNVSSMITFSVSVNQFSGGLPPDMGITLPNIQEFYVGGNRFSGPLPVSLGNASKIQMLEIRDNNFTGNLPSQFGALQNLFLLNLGNNHLGKGEDDDLSFITSLTNSTNLRSLSLDKNNFGGVIPNSISNLSTQMEKLYLGKNQMHGIIPQDIGNLVNLIALGLEENYFRGSIPSSIGNIQKLQRLFLWGNRLTGLIPSSLANATQLSTLFLQENELVGNIPPSFAHYQYLQVLFVARNNLSGMIPKVIFDISSLSIALDLSHNSFTGSLPPEVGNLIHLEGIDVSGNKLSGKIPSTLASCLSLQELYLGNNLFEGAIPQSLSSLKGLQYIDLSRNNLSGPIPVYFEKFQYLERLNLSFNELEGEVPTKGIFGNASIISVTGNSKLCGGIRELELQSCQSKSTKKQGTSVSLKLVIAICVPAIFLLAVLLILYLKRKPKVRTSVTSLKDQYYDVSYGDLFQATNGFSPTNLLGLGGFGRVYKGMLRRDEVVAVKVFNLQQKGASKSFMDECESMRSIRHRNLLAILTACSSMDYEGNEFKALVFEFMPNGSLEKWLYGDTDEDIDQESKLSLHQRLNIAVDVAYALHYLHNESHVSVIHRDLKPSNVLLDGDMVAHVSDFGLAKLVLGSPFTNSLEIQSTSISVKGSIGYTAPEYGMGGDASALGDVYSYGILLLELFTGRRPTDAMFIDGLNLHKFCKISLPDKVIEIVDPVLASTEELIGIDVEDTSQVMGSKIQNPQDCIASVVKIGVACSSEVPGERMNMGEVAKELQFIRDKSSAFL